MPRPLPAGATLGGHELIRLVGVGSTAERYLARADGRDGLEELIVVQRLRPDLAPARSAEILDAARALARLDHPHLVRVYDVGVDDGDAYIALEYVHGEDLGRIVLAAAENGVPIALDAALTIAGGLCAGLHYAHASVVHGDVAPSNVLVGYDGAVKLVDFGGGRALDPATAELAMKLAYLSPEHCRGRPLEPRSDQYGVGTILYELTTGQTPFAGATASALVQHIASSDPPPPSALVADYPEALEQIVLRALAPDPARRYPSLRELQVALIGFARSVGLRVSPVALGRLMATLFPARIEEWEQARDAGAFFVEQHVVRTLIESGKTGGVPPAPGPVEPAAPLGLDAALRDDTGTAEIMPADDTRSELISLGASVGPLPDLDEAIGPPAPVAVARAAISGPRSADVVARRPARDRVGDRTEMVRPIAPRTRRVGWWVAAVAVALAIAAGVAVAVLGG